MIFWLSYLGVRSRIHEGETILGRSGRTTLLVDEPSVSREHATIRRSGDCIEIIDLGSSNGTFVNGKPVTGTRRLAPGDKIRLGGAKIEVGATHTGPVNIGPGIELIEQQPRPSSSPQASTEPVFSSIDVLETLLTGAAVAENPAELAGMIRSSVDRLLDTTGRRGIPIDPDHGARLAAIVETVARWFPDGALDAWVAEVERRISG